MSGQAACGRGEAEPLGAGRGELDALSVELVELLGSPDPGLRVDLAVTVLQGWVRQGVYEAAPLAALGSLLCGGLSHGLGERGTPSVLRRSASAGLLAEVVTAAGSQGDGGAAMRGWRGGALGWAWGERDLRGWVPGWGPVLGAARGGDLLLALAESPHLGAGELPALLEATVTLLVTPRCDALRHREDEHLARAALAVLRRGGVTADRLRRVLEPAVAIAGARPGAEAWAAHVNTLGWLRVLHVELLSAAGEHGPLPSPSPWDGPPAAALVEVLAGVLRAYHAGPGADETG